MAGPAPSNSQSNAATRSGFVAAGHCAGARAADAEKDKAAPDWPDPGVALGTMMALASMHADVEATPILEKIENDKKMPEFMKVAAGKALDAFADVKYIKDKEKDKEKDKKTPDKK